MLQTISVKNQCVANYKLHEYFDFAIYQTLQLQVCNMPLQNKLHVANCLLLENILTLQTSRLFKIGLVNYFCKQSTLCQPIARIYFDFASDQTIKLLFCKCCCTNPNNFQTIYLMNILSHCTHLAY